RSPGTSCRSPHNGRESDGIAGRTERLTVAECRIMILDSATSSRGPPMRSRLGIVVLALAMTGCAKTSGVIVAAQPGLAACADLAYHAPEGGAQTLERRITDRHGEPTAFLASSLVAGLTADPSHDA